MGTSKDSPEMVCDEKAEMSAVAWLQKSVLELEREPNGSRVTEAGILIQP